MVSKDQAIGGAILAVCVIVAVVYVLLVLFPAQIYGLLGTVTANTGNNIRLDLVLILVSIAFIAILAIGAWIGWTMATTPPPKPIEEITTEIEEKKEEEKKEEPKMEEEAVKPAEPAEAPATEEKTVSKKKK
jgi:predicted DNA-binding transcriptional regulator